MSNDPFVDYLNLQHYNPIAIPREQFDPLLVLGGSSPTNLQPLGTLDDLLVPGSPLPAIVRDDTAATFANRRGKTADAKAGFNLLGGLLSTLGAASASVSAAYSGAAHFEYVYHNVLHDFVLPIKVMPAFTSEKIAPAVLESLAGFAYLYLVTDTLKSNEFGIVAYDEKGAALNLDADAIKKLVNAHAGLSVGFTSGSVASYSGPAHLRFAFRAMRLTYDAPKQHVSLIVADDFLVSKFTGQTPAADAFEIIAPGQSLDIAAPSLGGEPRQSPV